MAPRARAGADPADRDDGLGRGDAEAADRGRCRDRARFYHYLSATGGAALALTLGALVMLALPGDVTALVLLVLGVVGWTAVVLVSLHFQLRR